MTDVRGRIDVQRYRSRLIKQRMAPINNVVLDHYTSGTATRVANPLDRCLNLSCRIDVLLTRIINIPVLVSATDPQLVIPCQPTLRAIRVEHRAQPINGRNHLLDFHSPTLFARNFFAE